MKRLAVFFTRGVSLDMWKARGILERELGYYQRLAADSDMRVSLFTYGGSEDAKFNGRLGPLLNVETRPEYVPPWLYSVMLPVVHAKCLRQAGLVKTNQMDGSWAAVLTKWMFRKPLIVRCGFELLRTAEEERKGLFRLALIYVVEAIAYRAADRILVTSEQDRDYVARKFKFGARKLRIIPNGINTEIFSPRATSRRAPIVMFVGRLSKEKNVALLLESAKGTGWQVRIVGDGPLSGQLRAQAATTRSDVQFLGIVPNENLPALLRETAVFVLPSNYEGNPKALLEAMSCGIPCVTAAIKGVEGIIIDGVTGCLSARNPMSMRKAIQRLIDDPVAAAAIGTAARNLVERKYSMRAVVRSEISEHSALLGLSMTKR